MRGPDHQTGHLCGYVDPEAIVPQDHPLRAIRPLVNTALAHLIHQHSRDSLAGMVQLSGIM